MQNRLHHRILVNPPIMFRFKSADRLRAIFTSAFRPNALLRSSSPALMYSSRGGGVLPSELSRNVVRLTCESTAKGGICNVYLIEALPISPSTARSGHPLIFPYKDNEEDFLERNRSCYNVKVAIKSLKPQVVFLGLCPSVAHDLKQDQWWLLRSVRRFLDVEVIAEFRVAYEAAQKLGGKIILGNRPRKITWHRSNSNSVLTTLLLFLFPNRLSNTMEWYSNKDPEHREWYLKWEPEFFSHVREIFVDECDQYMSATLLNVAREHTTVVAVVSKLHLLGIQKYWKHHIEVEDLLSRKWIVPPSVTISVALLLLYLLYSHH